MKLRNIGSNMTELDLGGGCTVMFSYSTPVAGIGDDGAWRTDKHYSPTTTRHINKYLGGKDKGRLVPQAWIDSVLLLAGCCIIGGEG